MYINISVFGLNLRGLGSHMATASLIGGLLALGDTAVSRGLGATPVHVPALLTILSIVLSFLVCLVFRAGAAWGAHQYALGYRWFA